MLLYVLLLAAFASAARPDPLTQARCLALCTSHHDKIKCLKECEERPFEKFGNCPKEGPPLTLGCLKECNSDSVCPRTSKCCHHSCGITCQPPDGLDTAPGLPSIPINVTIHERWLTGVTIEWSHNSSGGPVLYVVEERKSTGAQYRESNMGEWTPYRRAPKVSHNLKTTFKPGTWYQTRVAAVNQNGTRGYSEPSKPFKLLKPPRNPDPPINLTLGSANFKNGSVSVVLSWEPPNSDLPISRYVVYWSRKITSNESPSPSGGSAFVHQKTVGHQKTSLRIRKLLPNNFYLLQVQAQAQYGQERLFSEKAGLDFNTTYATTRSLLMEKTERNSRGKSLSIRVSKLAVVNGQLSARVSWRARPHFKYAVTWEPSCGSKSSQSVVVMGSHFDLSGLQFECKYGILIREKGGGKKGRRHGKILFSTPSCHKFTPSAC